MCTNLFEVVALYIYGPIRFHNQERYVLVMIDHFARFVSLTTVDRNVNSKQIWETLLTKWISPFGNPRLLLTDNASYFISEYLKKKEQQLHHIILLETVSLTFLSIVATVSWNNEKSIRLYVHRSPCIHHSDTQQSTPIKYRRDP